MSTQITCDCGKQLRVQDRFAGKRIRCPACRAALTVPLPAAVETSAARQAPVASPRRGTARRPPNRQSPARPVRRALWPWVAGIAGAGVVLLGIVFLMIGLMRSRYSASTADAPVVAAAPISSPDERLLAYPPAPAPPKPQPKPKPADPAADHQDKKEAAPPAPKPPDRPKDDTPAPPAPTKPLESGVFRGHTSWVFEVAFSGDGQRILSSSCDYTLRLWDTRTKKQLRRFTGHKHHIVHHLALSRDGRFALSSSWDNTIRLWDVETGRPLRLFQGHTERPEGVAFSPDGRRALSGSFDKTMRLWDVSTGQELHRFEPQDGLIRCVAFSPDGRRAVAGCSHRLSLWDVESGKELSRFEGHTAAVMSVAFLPKGRRILSGSWDRTLRLWDAETGKELRRFEGHTDGVTSVAVSSDGHKALSSSGWQPRQRDGKPSLESGVDRTVRLWNLETGKELQRLQPHRNVVHSVAFSPDGACFASASHDFTLMLVCMKDVGRLARGEPLGHPPPAAKLAPPVKPVPPDKDKPAEKVGPPADPKIQLAKTVDFPGIWNPTITLAKALDSLSKQYNLKIEIDDKAFKPLMPTGAQYTTGSINVADPEPLPPLKAVKLATVLQLLLDQVYVGGPEGVATQQLYQAGYVIKRGAIVVVPVALQIPRDQSRTSPLTRKLLQPTDKFKDGMNGTLDNFLEFLHQKLALNIVAVPANRGKLAAMGFGLGDLRRKQVKLPPTDKAPLGKIIRQVLDQADCTYIVRADHILIVRKPNRAPPPVK